MRVWGLGTWGFGEGILQILVFLPAFQLVLRNRVLLKDHYVSQLTNIVVFD